MTPSDTFFILPLMLFSKHIRVGLCAFFAAFAVIPAAEAATLSQKERTLLETVNDVRAAHDLRPLQVDTTLAPRRAGLLDDDDPPRLLHPRRARPPPGELRRPRHGSSARTWPGAWAERRQPAAIVGSWLASPGHRANLLRPTWKRIGIGSRTGTFLGYAGATVVTADFAGV